MCTLVALRGREGLWLAANRDEKLDRPFKSPQLLLTDPPVWGGLDLVGGGSWLALNLEGRFAVGVTNARLGAAPGPRSRGSLVVELASQRSLADAVALLTELDMASFGPANLLLASHERVFVASNAPLLIDEAVGEVVTLRNEALDAPGASTRWASSLFEELAARGEVTAAALGTLLARHDGPDPICRHGNGYGTVCSSVLGLGDRGVAVATFAPGPPCQNPFREVVFPAGVGAGPGRTRGSV